MAENLYSLLRRNNEMTPSEPSVQGHSGGPFTAADQRGDDKCMKGPTTILVHAVLYASCLMSY